MFKIGVRVKISDKCPVKNYRGKVGFVTALNKKATTRAVTHCYLEIPNFNLRPRISVNNLTLLSEFDGVFQVGDIVKIVPNSRYDLNRVNNPTNTEGEVVSVYTPEGSIDEYFLGISVNWPRGSNAYSQEDLVFVRRP